MEEVAVERAGNPPRPLELDPAVPGERPDRRRLDPFVGGDSGELLPVAGGDGEHHPLLGLGDPHLRRRKALVFQRHLVEVDGRSEARPHLADGAGEATGPAIGDGVKQALARGFEDELHEHLLVDRVTDLHRPARLRFAVAGQLDAREGSAMDSVAPRAATGHDDQIPFSDLPLGGVARHDPHRSAEHQRIAEIAGMEGDGAGDRGDPHSVAVVANAGHDPREEPLGRDHPRRQVGGRRVRGCDAENVEVGDRLCAEAGAEDVADHPAEAGGGTAVRLDCRGVVVGLDLDADVVIAVEADDAGVVAEHAHAPVAPAERLTDFPRRSKHRLLEKVVVADGAGGTLVVDRAAEGLVAAVLAPRLGDRLELDLERRPAEGGKMIAHGRKLEGGQRQATLAAELRKRTLVEPFKRHLGLRERPRPSTGKSPQGEGADDDIVDRVARQQLPRQPFGIGPGELREPVFLHAPHGHCLEPQQPHCLEHALGGGVGDARLGENMEGKRKRCGGGRTRGVRGRRRGA